MNQSDWLRKRYRKGKNTGCAPEIGAELLIGLGVAWAVHSSLFAGIASLIHSAL